MGIKSGNSDKGRGIGRLYVPGAVGVVVLALGGHLAALEPKVQAQSAHTGPAGLVRRQAPYPTAAWVSSQSASTDAPVKTADGGPVFVSAWGSAVTGNGQFDYPTGIAVDSSGSVYVADSANSRIQKFTSSGDFLTTWGSLGSGDGQLYFPGGVAADAAGHVYVADTSNNRIEKFDSTGAFLLKWGTQGSGDGQFANPSGIAIGPTGNVYVADTGNSRVEWFDSNGTLLGKFGVYGSQAGQLQSPGGVAVDAVGDIYVADSRNFRIQKFGPSGNLLAAFTPLSEAPQSLALNAAGQIYVTGGNGDILLLDSSGTLIKNLAGPGRGAGQFAIPDGITVDGAGNIYVADYGNHRVQKLDPNGNQLTQWGSDVTGNGDFNLPISVACDVQGNVYVLDSSNLRIEKFNDAGVFQTEWTGWTQLITASSIAVDSSGYIYIAGGFYTGSGISVFDQNGNHLKNITPYDPVLGFLFTRAAAVAVDAVGNIYAVDSFRNGAVKLGPDGSILKKWGNWINSGSGDGQFSGPSGIAVDQTGNVYIADTYNDRVQKFDSNGNFVTILGGPGGQAGQFIWPQGVAVDAQGLVYVADTGNDRMQEFDQNGVPIAAWGSFGTGQGQFSTPRSVAVDGSGDVFVADSVNQRIQKFSQSQGPGFAIAFSNPTISVTRGSVTQVGLQIARFGGFTGAVTIIAPSPLPKALKIKGPKQITATGSTASFKLKIGQGAATGTSELTFSATDSTGTTKTAILTLQVQ